MNIRETFADERDCDRVRILSTECVAFAKVKKIEIGDTGVFELIQVDAPALTVFIFRNKSEDFN